MSGFFYNLGRKLGHQAVPAIRKSKWIWQGLAGDEAEALKAEECIGNAMATELRAMSFSTADARLATACAAILDQLVKCLSQNRRTFSCEVLHDAQPLATALPGGFLFVSDSLISLTDGHEEELAFVLAHEVAHVVRGHTWERVINDAALKVVGAVSMRAGQLGSWFRGQGMDYLRKAHTREQEFEADEFALRLTAAAGFPPASGIEWLERVGRQTANCSDLSAYFASHPPLLERIQKLRKITPSPGRQS